MYLLLPAFAEYGQTTESKNRHRCRFGGCLRRELAVRDRFDDSSENIREPGLQIHDYLPFPINLPYPRHNSWELDRYGP
jgi:hypothetical protein